MFSNYSIVEVEEKKFSVVNVAPLPLLLEREKEGEV
jgi:hypothetical protein